MACESLVIIDCVEYIDHRPPGNCGGCDADKLERHIA